MIGVESWIVGFLGCMLMWLGRWRFSRSIQYKNKQALFTFHLGKPRSLNSERLVLPGKLATDRRIRRFQAQECYGSHNSCHNNSHSRPLRQLRVSRRLLSRCDFCLKRLTIAVKSKIGDSDLWTGTDVFTSGILADTRCSRLPL